MSAHSRSASTASSPTFYCRALYDYQSTDPSALSFKAGDIIEILTTLDSGWWDGYCPDQAGGDRRGWLPSTFTEAISRDEAERELYARQFQPGTQSNSRPSVSTTEALVSAFNQTDISSSSDWLPDEMSYGIGRDSFSDLAHSSSVEDSHNHSPPSTVQPDDFWMPQFGDDGQIYYVNSQTGARSREMPSDELEHTPTSATGRARAGSALAKRSATPEPWVRRTGDLGVFYYENLQDGSVSWTRPSPQSTPRLEPLKHTQPPPPIHIAEQPMQQVHQSRHVHPVLEDDFGLHDDLPLPAVAPQIRVDADHSEEEPRSPSPHHQLFRQAPRPDSFVDPLFNSSMSFMDGSDGGRDFEQDNGGFMNRLSVYSDDSDIQPRSPMNGAFPALEGPRPEFNPQESLGADLRHAEELQGFLAIPEPPTLHQLSDSALAAIDAVSRSISGKCQAALIGHNFNERNDSLSSNDPETEYMVVAVRNLLHAFTAARAPPASAAFDVTPRAGLNGELEQQQSIPILQPQQRRVAATLSKMILSKRSYHVQMDWPASTDLVDSDAREMDAAIATYVRELETEGPPDARLLHGALVSAPGLAGIGLGSMGAGSAGKWRGGGFVDCQDYPSTELDDATVVHAQQLQQAAVSALHRLATVVDNDEISIIPDAQVALRAVNSFTDFALSVNVARLDVDGVAGDLPQTSRVDADTYSASVSHSRVLIRTLETVLQAILDDASALLTASQELGSLPEEVPRVVASITGAADLVIQTLRGMVEARKTQKRFAGSRALNESNLRVPSAHKGPQLPPMQSLPPITLPSASSSRYPSTTDMFGAASNPASATDLTSPSMIISPETVTDMQDYGDDDGDMVDFELAFSRDPARKPAVPNNFDANAPYYMSRNVDSRDSASPEIGDGFSNHSRTTSQPTTIGSRDGYASPTYGGPDPAALNDSAMELPTKDDEDDEDFASAKSSTRKRGPKIAQFFGDDAPEYMLNQMKKEAPEFLKPDYDPSDVMVNPDGTVRGGTLPALVERLTMHDFRDAIYFDTFLATFKTFTTAEELIELLIRRFYLQPRDGLTPEQLREWKDKKLTVVRARVLNTLKQMLQDGDILTRNDAEALNRIEEFSRDHEHLSEASSTQLKNYVGRVRRGEEQLRQMTMHTELPPPVIPPKNIRKMKLTDIDPLELARQLTIMESKLYCTIRGSECLQRSQEQGSKTDNIKNAIFTSNKLADWVADSILENEDHRKRANLIKLFILTAERCRALHNYSSMAALIAGLNSPPIRRLKRSWELVNQRLQQTFDSVERTLDSGRSFQNYKEELKRQHPPCVPFLGVYLTTLTFIQDGSPDLLKDTNLINFAKRTKVAEVMREIKTFQSKTYNLTPVPQIQQLIDISLSGLTKSADDFWEQSLKREPREQDEQKMTRLLTESGFL